MSVDDSRTEIFDLGYRNYTGPRLGRSYAVQSLFALSLRNTFGLGRGALPKVLAFGLAVLAFLPAVITLIFAALVGPADFEFLEPHSYYETIQVILVLFIAAMASDLVGNDRKNNTLVLYFSRPIRRDDYVLAKILALTAALLALTLLPQLLAFVGNWLGARDNTQWLTDNASDLLPIIVSAILVSVHLAAIGVLIASYSSRRAFALISVLGFFLFTSIASGILVNLLDRGWSRLVMLLSPLFVSRGATLVLFDEVPPVTPFSGESDLTDDQIAFAELPGWVWLGVLLVQTAIAIGLAVHRYRRAL